MSKRILSGIQPSGALHIGNYFGAIKQFIDFQDEYETYISIVNFHAMTTIQDGEKLRQLTYDAVVDHLAAGLDPEKATLFLQSDLPEVTELTWIFNCLITVPFLERAVAYKDKVAQGLIPNVGIFDYPVLQTSDILIMNPDRVPVGQDQKQHVEYARDIAEKFNNAYGETFKLPEIFIKEGVGTVPGIDGRKMSKSYGNQIPLFAEADELKKQVMAIVTDSKEPKEPKNPEEDNVFALHKFFTPADELEKVREGYEKGGLGYGESKKILLVHLEDFIAPLQEKRAQIYADKDYVFGVLEEGAQRARVTALKKMEEVREKVGLKIR